MIAKEAQAKELTDIVPEVADKVLMTTDMKFIIIGVVILAWMYFSYRRSHKNGNGDTVKGITTLLLNERESVRNELNEKRKELERHINARFNKIDKRLGDIEKKIGKKK